MGGQSLFHNKTLVTTTLGYLEVDFSVQDCSASGSLAPPGGEKSLVGGK